MEKADKKHRNRNRPGRRGDIKSSTQQRPTAGSRDGTPTSQQNRRGGAKGSQTVNRTQDTSQNGSTPASQPQPEEHMPLFGFNASAVEAMMSKNFDARAPSHKAEPNPSASRSESPWGAKAGAMGNGKDFWLELRKQVTALQKSGGTSQGG